MLYHVGAQRGDDHQRGTGRGDRQSGVLEIVSCSPVRRLEQHGARSAERMGQQGVNFYLPHREMLRLLRDTGFAVDELHKLYALLTTPAVS